MLASSPASILNHNRRPLGIIPDSISVDYALVFAFVLLGIAAMVGLDAAYWLAIGLGALVMVGLEIKIADSRSLLQLLAFRKSRYISLLIRARVYVESDLVKNHELLKDQYASLAKELPLVQARLQRIREQLGLPPRDLP